MTSDLDRAFLHYATNPTALDALREAVRLYAERVAAREGAHSPEDTAQEVVVKVWRALSTFERQSSFRIFVHTIVLNHLHGEARARKSRITLTPVEEMPERADTGPGIDRFLLDHFDDDERHLLFVLSERLDFTKAATELGLSPKALRSRLERLKARRLVEA
jgi:RNA polymerase sigma factor (sigma-70 family)